MENGLPENSMLPKNRRGVKLAEKALYFMFERRELFIKCGRHIAITGVVFSGDDEQMSFGHRGMVGNDAKQRSLFENIRANILVLAKCAAGTVCFSIQGDAAPVLHADRSLVHFHLTSADEMSTLPSREAEGVHDSLDPLEGTERVWHRGNSFAS